MLAEETLNPVTNTSTHKSVPRHPFARLPNACSQVQLLAKTVIKCTGQSVKLRENISERRGVSKIPKELHSERKTDLIPTLLGKPISSINLSESDSTCTS
jgi:hypothetical protein